MERIEMGMKTVTIADLANGACIERADLELERVLENIMDPNTSPGVCREINLKIKIKPTDDRTVGGVTIQATAKLAPVTEHMTQVYIGKDIHGKGEISEVIREDLFPEFKDNVTSIKKKEGTTNA
jgi:hypothetical protein